MTDTTSTEDQSTTAASEADSTTATTAATGAATEGGSGGSQTATDTSADETARLVNEAREQARREFQSERDRLRKELETAKAGTSPATPEAVTPEQMRAEMRKAVEITTAVPELQKQYPDADPSIYADIDKLDSVEALRAQAEASDKAQKARNSATEERIKAETRAVYEAKFGPLGETPTGTETTAPAGLPSVEEVARMSLDEMNALEAKHGDGAIKRILRSAATTT